MIALASGPLHAQNVPGVPPALPQTTTTTTTTVQTTGPAAASRPGGPVTLNFNNADIDAVARTIAVITGKNVVVDPRVKGTMTLVTATAVSPALALRQFSTQLRTQGFALVESSGLYLVVPEADAKLQSGAVFANTRPAPSGQIITQIFRLNYETANNLVPVLRPLISPNNTINVNPGNNSLIITDYADNLQRMGTIIAALDVVNATGVEIIRLQHAIATDLAPLVNRLIESGGAAGAAVGQSDTSFKTTLVAEPRSNSLILRAANPARLSLVRTLVEKLDQASAIGAAGSASPSAATGNIYVVYLKNADSTKLAATLRAAIAAGSVSGASGGSSASSPSASTSSSGSAGGVGGVSAAATGSLANNQPSTGGQIQADPATNSLIITAPEPQYRQLRAVIDKLDSRRAQVFIESLIAEVNTDKAAEFGVQFQTLLGTGAVAGTNFATGGANIFTVASSIAAGTPTASTGFNFAGVAQRNGQSVLGFLARFIETSGDGNILSTPNLLTLDNEEARIVIGQNVPFVTGSFTNTGSNNGSVNPFQTVERKDVGLTLRVKPQISEDGQVKLQIFQESSSVDPASRNSVTGLITNKRSIESNVVVNDGAIVVLGGLLQDSYSGNQDKVPGLSNLPVLGNLFKAEARTRSKTNLMVFLRPVVIRDGASSDSLSLDRYEAMRAVQKDSQSTSSGSLPVEGGAVMPPLRSPEMSNTLPKVPPPLVAPSIYPRPALPITPSPVAP
ncbi:MAG: type II secretion system secretin GspD [Polaromonas sp.]